MARSTTQNPLPHHTPLLSKVPLRTFNHISYAVPSPIETANFFEHVLGFNRIPRPTELNSEAEGAWICGMGVEIHFILQLPNSLPRGLDVNSAPINTRADHLSFLCPFSEVHWNAVRDTLKSAGIQFVDRTLPTRDLHQVSGFEQRRSVMGVNVHFRRRSVFSIHILNLLSFYFVAFIEHLPVMRRYSLKILQAVCSSRLVVIQSVSELGTTLVKKQSNSFTTRYNSQIVPRAFPHSWNTTPWACIIQSYQTCEGRLLPYHRFLYID